jgi:hypothetical protein
VSRGLSFFRLPDEEEFFLHLIASVRETVVFPVLQAPSRKELVPVPIEEYIPKFQPGDVIAFAWPNAKIKIMRSPNGKRFTILWFMSPVLQYLIGRVVGESTLEENHLGYESSYLADNN